MKIANRSKTRNMYEAVMPAIISGDKPCFAEKIFITRPNLPDPDEIMPLLKDMLARRWVTNFGHYHNELQRRLQDALGVKHVLPCCNGTIGLFLLLKALGVKGRIVTTPFTFPATIHAISMADCKPLFCDIDPDDYSISPASVSKNITKDVSAILAVNVFGNISDTESLERIGDQYGIPVLYDSAHSFMSSFNGRRSGSFGRAEMFSFHATKLFTTLEGGAIATNDDALYNRLKLMINFGIKDEEHVVDVGLNGKMTELNAIFGLIAFDKVGSIIAKMSSLAAAYRARLVSIPGIKLQNIRKGCEVNNQYMAVEVMPQDFGLTRDELCEALKYDNIYARKYFFPSGQDYDCYKDLDFAVGADVPVARAVSSRILCLPIYNRLSETDVQKICDLLSAISLNSSRIRKKLKRSGVIWM